MNLHGKIPQHTSRVKNKINAVIYIEGWPGNARKKTIPLNHRIHYPNSGK